MNAPTRIRGRRAHRKLAFVKRVKNNTGQTGITEQIYQDPRGGRAFRVFIVTPHGARFNIDTLGRPEAWRRALSLRADHERAVIARQLAMPRSRLAEAARRARGEKVSHHPTRIQESRRG